MRKLTYILLLLIVALFWVTGASAQYSGQFKVINHPVTDNPLVQLGNGQYILKYANESLQLISIEPQIFNETAVTFNRLIALPIDIPIILTECESGPIYNPRSPFYDPELKQIVMCYEYTDYLVRSFAAQGETRKQSVFDAANTTLFIFFHELGHGLIDLYKLPVLGRSEDAADGLAIWLLLQANDIGVDMAFSTAKSWITLDTGQNRPSDVHASNQQRYYNLVCYIIGSNPQKYFNTDWVQDTNNPVSIPYDYRLPLSRARGCEREYQQLNESWDSVLSPYLLTSNATTPTARVTAGVSANVTTP